MEKSPPREPSIFPAGIRELFAALLLLVMPAVASSAGDNSQLDARVSDLYVERGMLLYDQGLYQEARELSEKAVEFAPNSPDALLLHARILEKPFGLTRQAVAELEKALASGGWSRGSALQARRLLSGLLLKTRRYEDALAVVRVAGVTAEAEPELLSIKARALYSLGRRAEAGMALSEAVARFPKDPALRAWRMHFADSASAEDGRWVREYMKNDAPDGLPVLKYVEKNAVAAENRALLEALWKTGHSSSHSYALAVRNELAVDESQGRFLSAIGTADYADLRGLALSAPDAQKAKLNEALKNMDIRLGFDSDGDGFTDRIVRLEKGEVRQVSYDQDQDGEPERELFFELRRPVRYVQSRSDGNVTVFYDDYPAVSAVSMRTAGRVEYLHRIIPDAYEFTLGSADLPPAVEGGSWLPGFELMPLEETDFSLLRVMVYLVEENRDGIPYGTRHMEKGSTFLSEENIVGSRAVSRRVWYGGGIPLKGERDLDGNGFFETSESFRNGILASIAFDANGNGNPEFSETYLNPLRRAWDVNDDGIIDIEEYNLGRGKVQRAFSVDLDGIFNQIRLDDRAYWDLMEKKATK